MSCYTEVNVLERHSRQGLLNKRDFLFQESPLDACLWEWLSGFLDSPAELSSPGSLRSGERSLNLSAFYTFPEVSIFQVGFCEGDIH